MYIKEFRARREGVVFYITLFLFSFFLLPAHFAEATVAFTPATGGSGVSADTAGGTFTSLSGPVISEGATADIGVGTIILNAPSGFVFDTGGTAPTVLVTRTSGSGASTRNINDLASGSTIAVTRTTTQLTITITAATSNGVRNSLTWQNVRVRPTAGTPLASGNIVKTGTSAIAGITNSVTNLGTLAEAAGVKNKITITTQPSSSVTAGADFTVKPAIAVQDQFGNTVTTDSTTVIAMSAVLSTQVCGGTAGLGTLASTPVSGAAVSGGVIPYTAMSYTAAESIKICFTSSGITSAISNTVTVSPGALDHFSFDSIATQIVDTAFSVTISAKDAYSNTVTGFAGTVDLATTAGTISPVLSGAFVSGLRTESVAVTQSGTTQTITATDHAGTGKMGTSNTFTVNNPVPTITSITPTSKTAGDAEFALTVNGTNFVSSSVVKWNGFARTTTFVSATRVTAVIPATDIASSGTANITVTNPTPGGGDSNAEIFTINIPVPPATKFVILNPADGVVGSNVTVTIQAQDADSNIVTTYQDDVTLSASGSATGAGLVGVVNGVGTIQISDETAETVNLTLSDTQATGLDISSTQDVVFAVGALSQFTLDNPGDTTAGTRVPYSVTRRDQFGNPVTSGASTVYLYTSSTSGLSAFSDAATAGNTITFVTIADGVSSANFWYSEGRAGTFSITVSDSNNAPDGTVGVDDASDSIAVSSGPTSVFILNDPGDMSVGTRLGYTVTRKDSFQNLVTSGDDVVYLYSTSSSLTKAFYDAGTAGNIITSVTITGGSSAANFWYFDDTNGTWTITASDNATEADGTAGIQDATDNVTVSLIPVTATKIIIIDPNDSTAGGVTAVTIKAVDNTGALDASFNNTVTLNVSGSGIGGGVITISSGIGTANINDNVAETVTVSLSDTGGTGLDVSSTQDIIFAAGPVSQFIINDPGDGAAGARFGYTVTRKDQFGNLVTSGISTVYLYTNSLGSLGKFYDAASGGAVVTSANINDGQSDASFWYEEGTAGSWTVTVSDSNTAPDGATGVADATDAIAITPATIHEFILNDPGNMSVSTRLGYTVTRKDAFGNLVTSGPQDTYLYSSSASANKAFYNAATLGNTVTFITIPDGASSADFWYFDDTAGTSTITASDNSSLPDGVTGVVDATDNVTVSTASIVATKLVIGSVSDTLVGTSVTVTIMAEDNDGNVATAFADDVTLMATGSVTGEGVVHILNGVGTIDITDSVAETVTLSLQDTASTGLNVSSTQVFLFVSVEVSPPASGGGGGGGGGVFVPTPTFAIRFSGSAFPGSLINLLGIPVGGNAAQAVVLSQQQISSGGGSFNLNLTNPDTKSAFYAVGLTDKNNVSGQLKIFASLPDVATLSNIVFAPTITLLRTSIRQGDFLSVSGYANPGSAVQAELDGVTIAARTAVASDSGAYKLLVPTANLELGKHSIRVRHTVGGKPSEFSLSRSFTLSNIFRPGVDFNDDGAVDVRDVNIFLSSWISDKPEIKARDDFNGDGKVDVQDLSIFAQSLKK